MVKLSDFTNEETELLYSVVYRAGIYISYAEDEGGDDDDAREHHALEVCIGEIARVHPDDFVRDVALGVMDSKDRWPVWADNVHAVEAAATKAVSLVKSKGGADAAKKYVKMVLDIASAVAHAYGEFGLDQKPDKGLFGKIIQKIVGGHGKGGNDGHPMNVSAAEDDAIARLSEFLKKGL